MWITFSEGRIFQITAIYRYKKNFVICPFYLIIKRVRRALSKARRTIQISGKT